ncbi:unnamed protein product [Closterium sp. Naga37s-1]|nr:unnamed protein product [Closterium sp. Naga37s-1]
MPERELIQHAGLDSVVFLHTLKLGFKIFVPILLLAAAVLFPINFTGGSLEAQAAYAEQQVAEGNTKAKLFEYSEIDKLSIANVPDGSPSLWAHVVMAWVFNLWALYVLRDSFKHVARMRLDFLADQQRAPNQYTVLVRQVPADPIKSIPETVDHFFSVNHSDHYLLTQDGFLGMMGTQVDSIEFYTQQITEIKKEILQEREKVVNDSSSVMPAAFVSFRTRWGAAVAAQTLQSKDSSQWITVWAPEQRDVKWENLPVPYVSIMLRRIVVGGIVIATILGYTFPVSFVQSLANIDQLAKVAPFLEPILNVPFINAFVKSILSGIALKIFLAILPMLLTFLSTAEGYTAKSGIDLAATGKYFYFIIGTVFFANVLGGVLLDQAKTLSQNPSSVPQILGDRIPTKATFFMTYTMLDGWTGMAMEVLQLVPLIMFHIKNNLLVRTPADRIKVMNPSPLTLIETLYQVELYFLLPFVYCVSNPLYLIFAIVFFVLAFVAYRNQMINVYNAEYETAGAYWPHFHSRLIASMIIQHLTLIGIFALKEAKRPDLSRLKTRPKASMIIQHLTLIGIFALKEAKLQRPDLSRLKTRRKASMIIQHLTLIGIFSLKEAKLQRPDLSRLKTRRKASMIIQHLTLIGIFALKEAKLQVSPPPPPAAAAAAAAAAPAPAATNAATAVTPAYLEALLFASARLAPIWTRRRLFLPFNPSVPTPSFPLPILFILAFPSPPSFHPFPPPMQEANRKDTIDRTISPDLDPSSFLARAYLHPSLQSAFQLLDEEQDGQNGADGGEGEEGEGGDGAGKGGEKDGKRRESGDMGSDAEKETKGGAATPEGARQSKEERRRSKELEKGGERRSKELEKGREKEPQVKLVAVKRHPRSTQASPAPEPVVTGLRASSPLPAGTAERAARGMSPVRSSAAEAFSRADSTDELAFEDAPDFSPERSPEVDLLLSGGAGVQGGPVRVPSPATAGTLPLLQGRSRAEDDGAGGGRSSFNL